MIDALKFIWAYMLEEGRITTGKWCYYAGQFDYTPDDEIAMTDAFKYTSKFKDMLLEDVKKIGINWGLTKEPKGSIEYEFNGTYDEASKVETLLGTLYLNDGSKYIIGVGNSEKRFSEYAIMLSKLAEDSNRVKNILGE
jgi:hypothetical protein